MKVEILSSLELDRITNDFSTASLCKDFKHINRYYRDLSETKLITIRDLLRFMLTLKSRVPFQSKSAIASTNSSSSSKPLAKITQQNKSLAKDKAVKWRKFSSVAASLDSRWPVRRLEYVANVVVDALKEKRATNKAVNAGMTRQEARDAARLHIGDTGLIDYVLKSMNNVVVGGLVVRRAMNPSTRVLEYTIQEFGNDVQDTDPEPETIHEALPPPTVEAENDVQRSLPK